MKITDEFIEKITLERDLLLLIKNVGTLAMSLKEVQSDIEKIKKQLK